MVRMVPCVIDIHNLGYNVVAGSQMMDATLNLFTSSAAGECPSGAKAQSLNTRES